MKYSLTLGVALFANWLLWSGHFDNPFLIGLGLAWCAFSVWLGRRMQIVDEEGAPVQMGTLPFTHFAPWLALEIVRSNVAVTKIILARKMPLQRTMIEVSANQKSALGRVMLANSITLTPGTVAVNMHGERGDQITVHALSFEGAEDDLSGEIDRRICRLESKGL